VRKRAWYNFRELFSPLDLATISYILLSGIYICFDTAGFKNMLPHFVIRILVLALIISIAALSRKFQSNKVLLFLRNLYPLLFLGFFYPETSCMKNIIFETNLDKYFFDAEQSLWNCQPSVEFSKTLNQGWFNELMNMCYFSYYIIIGLACIVLYFNNTTQSQKSIFIVILSFYMYYLIFAVLPVVGPQYYISDSTVEITPPHFFGKLMHWIITDIEQPTGAFPSSHVGIAVIIAYITYHHLRKLFFIILPFVLGICFATVYIKAHYLVDVIAGIISAPMFIVLSVKIYNKFLSWSNYYMYKKA
jgi:membrane-associated phospholipid phosphatase